ncbi:hypothetical protein AAVH_32751, partial [Aphelenchoides avenae]
MAESSSSTTPSGATRGASPDRDEVMSLPMKDPVGPEWDAFRGYCENRDGDIPTFT